MADIRDSIIQKTSNGISYYKGLLYPNIPVSIDDNYVITTSGDRLDLLAYQYYKDPELWWVISIANNNINNGFLFPKPGTQLRIPANPSAILNLIRDFNSSI
jgi:nucleoid-associated protein YgaU